MIFLCLALAVVGPASTVASGLGQSFLGIATVLASGLPAAFSAYFSYRAQQQGKEVKRELKTANGHTVGESSDEIRHALITGNDKTVGEMVTEVHGKESTEGTAFGTHRKGE